MLEFYRRAQAISSMRSNTRGTSMRHLTICALFLSFLAVPAFAQSEASSVEGPYIAAIGALDHVDDGVDGVSGAAYGVATGYDLVAGSKIVIGGELEASLSTAKKCVSNICAKAGRDLYGGARIGYLIDGTSMIYAKVGYTNARIRGTFDDDTVVSENLDGLRLGAGIEATVGRGLLVRLEYRYSNYEQDVTRHQGLLGVGFRF